MSLVEAGYSSDEDISNDAFGLTKLQQAKKARTEAEKPSVITEAAPHVLSEV